MPEMLSVYRALHHAAHFAVSKDASKKGENIYPIGSHKLSPWT